MAHSTRVRAPGPVSLYHQENVSDSWREFKRRFALYLHDIDVASPETKFTVLMEKAGPEAVELYESFKEKLIIRDRQGTVIRDDSKNYDRVMDQFDRCFKSRSITEYYLHCLRERRQESYESTSTWMKELHRQCARLVNCELRRCAIQGARDENFKNFLIQNPKTSPLEAVQKAEQSSSRGSEDTQRGSAHQFHNPPAPGPGSDATRQASSQFSYNSPEVHFIDSQPSGSGVVRPPHVKSTGKLKGCACDPNRSCCANKYCLCVKQNRSCRAQGCHPNGIKCANPIDRGVFLGNF